MRSRLGNLAAALMVVASATIALAATKEDALKDVKCLIAGKKDASAEKASKWKDGEVYFCCGGCLSKFEKMDKDARAKLAPKANHQLVATKQYKQGGCPFSGGTLNKEMTLKVAGTEVGFCCAGCLAKAKKMSDEDKMTKLFGEEAFKKAKYKLVKKEKK
ncbi:MAG: hypothetical protein Aurels2KO_31580 [Aureliella sp.]